MANTKFVLPEKPPTVQQRVELTFALQHDVDLREEVMRRLRRDTPEDCAWFINAFCWTYDSRPDAPRSSLPFILYNFQDHYIRWIFELIEDMEDGVLDKSRDMGVSWTTLGFVLYKFLFSDGFNTLIGSRKEQYVDDRTMKSLFPRIRYMLNRLPGWMMPKGWDPHKHDNHMRLKNPANENEIDGESSNSDFSRGGRYSIIIFDEAAFWADFEASWSTAAESTRTRLAISTPLGMNAFGRVRHAKRADGSTLYRVLTLLWKLHPNKDESWRERTERRYVSEAEYQREVEISYDLSLEGVVYSRFRVVPVGYFPYEYGMPLYVSWDFGIGDDTAIIFIAQNLDTRHFRIVDCYSNSGKPISWYVPLVTGKLTEESPHYNDYGYEELHLINRSATRPRAIHFGDPAGTSRELTTGRSVIDTLAEGEIFVHVNHKNNKFMDRKVQTEKLIPRIEGLNEEHCEPVRVAMLNYRFPDRNTDAQFVTPNARPIHNWASHFATCLEYFAVNIAFTYDDNAPYGFQRPEATRNEMAYEQLGRR